MNMRLSSGRGGLALLALLACVASGVAVASADDTDPPGRLARLSDAQGSVSLQPAGVQDWTAATVNRPVTIGDKLWSDQNSRAELDIGAAAMRLGGNTGFSFLNLDDHTAQMQITAGTLIVHVRNIQSGETYEIDTPNVALTLLQPGDYRVEVNEAGDTTVVKVSAGAAVATGGGQTVTVSAQQQESFTGTDTLAYQSATLGAPDDFDNWSAARERRVQDSAASQYVASDVPGTQELDDNGQWQETPDYGYVWRPTTVVVGWVPYRFGHWVWIAPWGWTWIDDAPWGYAPFHYGRWVEWNEGWCWVPGPRFMHPVYAPALVAWVGGPGASVSVAFGSNVGWFPLGPREVWVPGYGASPAYVRQVNITNTTIINNTYITNVQNNITPTHYVNNRAGVVTAVPEHVFTAGQRVGAHVVPVSAAVLASVPVTPRPPAVAPLHQSVLGPVAARGAARPPATVLNRPVVARMPPPRAPVPFDKQVAALKANGGRPLGRAELARLQPATPVAPVKLITPAARASAPPPQRASATRPVNEPQQRAGAARPANAPPQTPAAAGATSSLAERERVLQQSRIAPPPRTNTAGSAPSAPANTYVPPPKSAPAPESRVDRPPWAQPNQPSTPQRPFTQDDPAHARAQPPSVPVYHPPSVPVYHPPAATEAPARPQESPRNEESYRAPPRVMAAPPPAPSPPPAVHSAPPPPPPPPPPVVHPQPAPPPAPARAPPAREPREAAPHSDRDSRDRGQR